MTSIQPGIRHALVLAALLAATQCLVACGKGEAKSEQADKKPPPAELAAADVALVSAQPLSRELPLSGSLMPVVQALVKSKVAGEVLSVTVREGQRVQKGMVIARIDTQTQQAMADSQRATVEKLRADAAVAQQAHDNNQRLLQKKFVAPTVVDTSRSALAAALAAVEAAEAQARMAQIGLADATVRAPVSGVVAQRKVQPGEKVSPDTPLFSIVDLSVLELAAAVPASEVPAIEVGQRVHFTVDGFGDRAFSGTVERINPVAETGSRSILVYLAVPNADGRLKGGMFAQGRLVLDAMAPSPVIPLAALRNEGGQSTVLLVQNDRLVARSVTLGLKSEQQGLVQVTTGLAVGERVLATNSSLLQADMAVTLKPPATTQAAVGAAASPQQAR